MAMQPSSYLKVGFGHLKLQFGKIVDILGLDELVPIHPAGLVEPKTNQVHWSLQAIRCGKQDALSIEYEQVDMGWLCTVKNG